MLATEAQRDDPEPHLPILGGSPPPNPESGNQRTAQDGWGRKTPKSGWAGLGSVLSKNISVSSVANDAVPHLHAVEVPNVPIDDRTAKHERDRRRRGEKDTKRHQAISFAEVERYEYQRAEQRAAENGE